MIARLEEEDFPLLHGHHHGGMNLQDKHQVHFSSSQDGLLLSVEDV